MFDKPTFFGRFFKFLETSLSVTNAHWKSHDKQSIDCRCSKGVFNIRKRSRSFYVRFAGFLHCINEPYKFLCSMGNGNIVMLPFRNLLPEIGTETFVPVADILGIDVVSFYKFTIFLQKYYLPASCWDTPKPLKGFRNIPDKRRGITTAMLAGSIHLCPKIKCYWHLAYVSNALFHPTIHLNRQLETRDIFSL